MHQNGNTLRQYWGIALIGLLIVSNVLSLCCQIPIKINNLSNGYQVQGSETSIATNFTMSKIASYDDSLGVMKDVFIQDDLAFVAVKWGGLEIFNISDLENPVRLWSHSNPLKTIVGSELTSEVFVRGDVAFIADGYNGLQIINVSNPMEPYKIGSYSIGAFNVFVCEDIAYVSTSSYTLALINITDLTAPKKISEEEFIGINEIYFSNGLIVLPRIVSAPILNVTNPEQIEVITLLNNTGACIFHQEYIFSIQNPNRLVIYEIAALPSLQVVANFTLEITGSVIDLCVNEDFLYAASTEEIIQVDIKDLAALKITNKLTNMNWYYNEDSSWVQRSLATLADSSKSNILLFTDCQRGLFIYDFTQNLGETLVSFYDCGMRTKEVTSDGNYVYITSIADNLLYPSKLEIFKFGKDNIFEKIGTYFSNSSIWKLMVIEDYVFLAVEYKLEVIDIRKPSHPVKVSEYEPPAGIWDMAYDQEQKILYLCCGYSGLLLLDVSDIDNITLLDQASHFYGYGYFALSVYLNQGKAYVVDGSWFGGFGVIDVTNPTNITELLYITHPYFPVGIYVQGDLVFLICDTSPIFIFNITNVSEPSLVSTYDDGGWPVGEYQTLGDILFMLEYSQLTLLNIGDSTNIQKICSFAKPIGGTYQDIFIEDSLLFLTCAWAGIEVWQLPEIEQPVGLQSLLFTIFAIQIGAFILIIAIVIQRNRTIDRQ